MTEQLATDHTVLTIDPRGHFGSVLDDWESDSTPELRADDLARILWTVDAGSATVVGSSGGAITTLALLQSAPELVATAVAPEPPLAELLDDRDEQRAIREDVVATYRGGDEVGAMRTFFASADLSWPEEEFERMLATRGPADIANDRYFYLHELQGTAGWRPDLDALRAVRARLIIGIGETSGGLFCDRASRALATDLKIEPTLFPGGHAGFLENPVGFAARLREVID